MSVQKSLAKSLSASTHFDERERIHHRHKRRRHRRAWGRVRQGCLRAVRWLVFDETSENDVTAKLTLETESEGLIPATIRRKQNNPAEIRSHGQLRCLTRSSRALPHQNISMNSPTWPCHRSCYRRCRSTIAWQPSGWPRLELGRHGERHGDRFERR